MSRFLEPPNPKLSYVGKYLRLKYVAPDRCEIPYLRTVKVLQQNEEQDYLLCEQMEPLHGIRRLDRSRIVCYEILDDDWK